jgi:hypothetical protein
MAMTEKEFNVTCSQSLSKSTKVYTVDYEVYYDPEYDGNVTDTSDTDWEEVYCEDHFTPIQLIDLFKRYLEEILQPSGTVSTYPSYIKHLIAECDGWIEDETVICED